MKYFLIFLALSLSSVFFFGMKNASAASIWDDTIQVEDTLTIRSYNGVHTQDVTANYLTLIGLEPTCSSTLARFNDVVSGYPSSGAWHINMVTYGSEIQVRIQFTEISSSTIDFSTESGLPQVTLSNTIGFMELAMYNSGDTVATCAEYPSEQPGYIYRDPSVTSGQGFIQFLTTYLVNYPEDYDGVEIPSTGSPPIDPLPWTPRINAVSVIDWEITLQDQNFNTFDPPPFTCNGGLTPIIYYILYNHDTSSILSEGIFSPTIQYVFQSERFSIETEYRFNAIYSCGDEPTDPTFNNYTNYYFTVNPAGFLQIDTASCFTEEFPFIDVDGCTTVIEDFINNLTFGTIVFPEFSIQPNDCHTLTTIGDWINVDPSSRLICPQFSSTIRNAVTPFLTFVMGITIMGAIVTKSRSSVV